MATTNTGRVVAFHRRRKIELEMLREEVAKLTAENRRLRLLILVPTKQQPKLRRKLTTAA